MMPYQKVHVVINKKDGKMTMEADGFVGTQCDVLTEIETQLGSVSKTEDKAERYQYLQPDYVPNMLSG
jgi:hypothetical protein